MRIRSVAVLMVGMALAGGAGCASTSQPATGAADGAAVIDPVCGMEATVYDGSARAEHAGEVYHFCSVECADRFAADPASFASR